MKIYDSCGYRVTLADVAEDIARDIKFDNYLKKLHENREAEKRAKQKLTHQPKEDKEKN